MLPWFSFVFFSGARSPCRSILELPGHGASWWSFELQYCRDLEPKYFPFLQKFSHIPKKIFTRSCPVLSNVIVQANKHKTYGEKILSQALLVVSINLMFCLESLLLKKGLWKIPSGFSIPGMLGLYIYVSWQLFPPLKLIHLKQEHF